jgi:hypothetical protein
LARSGVDAISTLLGTAQMLPKAADRADVTKCSPPLDSVWTIILASYEIASHCFSFKLCQPDYHSLGAVRLSDSSQAHWPCGLPPL